MDALERKVELLSGENSDYKKKIENLEESNTSLLSQLHKLQALLARGTTPAARFASVCFSISYHSFVIAIYLVTQITHSSGCLLLSSCRLSKKILSY